MLWHSGILDRPSRPRRDDERELTILALTPGIPFEWVIWTARLNDVRKATLKRNMRDAAPGTIQLADQNAQSVTDEDALQMMLVIPKDYRGAIPLYSQLWLASAELTDAQLAKMIGVSPIRAHRWRRNTHFCPLTGARL